MSDTTLKDIYEAVTTPNLRFFVAQKAAIAAARTGLWPYQYSDVFIKTQDTQGAKSPTQTRIWAEAAPINSGGSLYVITVRESEKPASDLLETPGREQVFMVDGESLLRPAQIPAIIADLEKSFVEQGFQKAGRQPFAARHANLTQKKNLQPL